MRRIFQVSLLLFMLSNAQAEETSLSYPEAISTISEHRAAAEQWVRKLKEKFKPENDVYQVGEILYGHAQARFEGIVDQLITGMTLDEPEIEKPSFQRKLKKAVDHSQAFIQYAQKAYNVDSLGVVDKKAWSELVSAALEPLVNAFVTVWKEYRSESTQRRREIIARLDKLRWKSFNAI